MGESEDPALSRNYSNYIVHLLNHNQFQTSAQSVKFKKITTENMKTAPKQEKVDFFLPSSGVHH